MQQWHVTPKQGRQLATPLSGDCSAHDGSQLAGGSAARAAGLQLRAGWPLHRQASTASQYVCSTPHMPALTPAPLQLVVVGKQARNEWLAQYEGLTEFVVPRSSEVGGAGRSG